MHLLNRFFNFLILLCFSLKSSIEIETHERTILGIAMKNLRNENRVENYTIPKVKLEICWSTDSQLDSRLNDSTSPL